MCGRTHHKEVLKSIFDSMSKKRNKQDFDVSTIEENVEVRPLSGYPERDDTPEPYSGNWPEISIAYRTSVAGAGGCEFIPRRVCFRR